MKIHPKRLSEKLYQSIPNFLREYMGRVMAQELLARLQSSPQKLHSKQLSAEETMYLLPSLRGKPARMTLECDPFDDGSTSITVTLYYKKLRTGREHAAVSEYKVTTVPEYDVRQWGVCDFYAMELWDALFILFDKVDEQQVQVEVQAVVEFYGDHSTH